MSHPPGSIIIATQDLTRYASFCRSLASLWRPEGTELVWSFGSDIAFGYNQALARRSGAWSFIMADDHVFAPDLLLRLLDREVDVVSPLVSNKKPPFCLFVFKDTPEQEMALVPIEEIPLSGLHVFDGCSGAALLMREHVLQKISYPFYEPGQIRADQLNEDTYLMQKIRQAGFSIHVDCDLRMGHTGPVTVWPQLSPEGAWHIQADFWNQIPPSSATRT